MEDGGPLRVGRWLPAPRCLTGRIGAGGAAATKPDAGDDEPNTSDGDHGPETTDDGWPPGLGAPGEGREYRGGRRAVIGLTALIAVIATLFVVPTVVVVQFGARAPLPPRAAYPSVGTPRATPSVPPGAPPTPVLTPTTYEAEAPTNTVTGSAHAGGYPGASGGMVVRTVGNWGNPMGDGTLRFNDVVVPVSAVYALTFYYVHPDNAPSRSAVITVSGLGSIVVTVSGNAACCASQTVRILLHAGANAITFSNPWGHAPSIDKIILGAP